MPIKKQPIKMFTNGWIDKISADMNAEIGNLVNGIVETLSYIGERAVTIAREQGNYMNRTGNLRSSIGYIILQDGEPVRQSGDYIVSGAEGVGDEGAQKARELLARLQSEFPQGIVLIVCAGMNYASYVEDIHGKDVLTSAQLDTEETAERMLNKLLQQSK